jgi:undecaprenyl-diphosphatase
MLLILTIGFTRIYLRVHYATDVIAGYCVGFLWLVFAVWLLNKMENYSKRKFDSAVEKPEVSTTG